MLTYNRLVFGLSVCAIVIASSYANAEPKKLARWGSTFNNNRATDTLLALYTFEQTPCANFDSNGNKYFNNFADASIPRFPTLVAQNNTACVSADGLFSNAEPGLIITKRASLAGESAFKLSDASSVEHTGMSIDFWFFVASMPADAVAYRILELSSTEFPSRFHVDVHWTIEGQTIPTLRVQDTNNVGSYIEWTLTGFSPGREHHITVTYDASSSPRRHTAYLDAVLLSIVTIIVNNQAMTLDDTSAGLVDTGVDFLRSDAESYALSAFAIFGADKFPAITVNLLSIYASALSSTRVQAHRLAGIPNALPVLATLTELAAVEDTPVMLDVTDLLVYGSTSTTSSVVFISLPQCGKLTTSADNTSLPFDTSDLLVGNLWDDVNPIWYHPATNLFGNNLDNFQVALLSDACIASGDPLEQCIVPGGSIEFNIEPRNDAPVGAVQKQTVFFGALMEITMEFTDVDIVVGSAEQLTVNFESFSELVTGSDPYNGLDSYDSFVTQFTLGSCTDNGEMLLNGSSVVLAESETALTLCFNSTNTKNFLGFVASSISYILTDKAGLSSALGRLELDWVMPLRLCNVDPINECMTSGLNQGGEEPQNFSVIAYDMRQLSERAGFEYEFLFYYLERSETAGTILRLGPSLNTSEQYDRNSYAVPSIPTPAFIDGDSNMLTADLQLVAAPDFYALGPNGERLDLNGRDIMLASGDYAPILHYRLKSIQPGNFVSRMVSGAQDLVIATRTDGDEVARITSESDVIWWAGARASPFGSIAMIEDTKAINDFTFFSMNVTCEFFYLTAENISESELGLKEVDPCVYDKPNGCLEDQMAVVGTTQALNSFLSNAIRLYPTGPQFQRTGCIVSVSIAGVDGETGQSSVPHDNVRVYIEIRDGPVFHMVATVAAVCVALGLLTSVTKWNRNIDIVLQRADKRGDKRRRVVKKKLRSPRQNIPSVIVAREVRELPQDVDDNRTSIEKPTLYRT